MSLVASASRSCPSLRRDLGGGGCVTTHITQKNMCHCSGLVRDVIEHLKRHAVGLRTVAFCCTVAHAKHVAAQCTGHLVGPC